MTQQLGHFFFFFYDDVGFLQIFLYALIPAPQLFVLAGPVLMGLLGIGIGLLALSKIRRSHRSELSEQHHREAASEHAAE